MLNPSQNKTLRELIIILPIVGLSIIFLVLLVKDVQTVHRTGVLRRNIRTVTILDVGNIQSWMTFHYINTIFNIPEVYLKDFYQIADSRYPNLTIKRYVKDNKLNELEVLATLKQSVRDYLTKNKSN